MKLTKYGHACLFLNNNGPKIIIDPGCLTELPTDLTNVVAVIITHPHADHLDIKNLQQIARSNSKLKIYGIDESIKGCEQINATKIVIDKNTTINEAGLEIDLYYVDHAVIYKTSPCKNLAVKVANELYYPGDSFHVIPDLVKVVAVPVSAPWLKTSESIDFALAINAKTVFPTHDGLFNDAGQQVTDNWLSKSLEEANKEFRRLAIGESL